MLIFAKPVESLTTFSTLWFRVPGFRVLEFRVKGVPRLRLRPYTLNPIPALMFQEPHEAAGSLREDDPGRASALQSTTEQRCRRSGV